MLSRLFWCRGGVLLKFPVKHYKTEYGNSPLKKYLEDLGKKNKIDDIK